MKSKIQKHHFTLIELLVVCGILLILAGIGMGVYSLVNRKMNDSRCHAMIAKMSIALENYKAKTGYYIQQNTANTAFYMDVYSSNYSLNNEIDIPLSERGGVSGGDWKDPYNGFFRYQCPGTHNRMSFDLYSFGSDKINGTEDDITNWKQ